MPVVAERAQRRFAPLSPRPPLHPRTRRAILGRVTLLHELRREYARRTQRNPRYSLRAFARGLGVDHATLSQWFRNVRPMTPRAIETVGWKLGRAPRELRAAFDAAALDATSRRILDAVSSGTRLTTPELARDLGVSIDGINIALQRLLRRGLLQMDACGTWRCL